jgi:hypothetical protein
MQNSDRVLAALTAIEQLVGTARDAVTDEDLDGLLQPLAGITDKVNVAIDALMSVH